MTLMRKRDLLFGLLGVVAGVFLFVESLGMTYPSKTFPLMVSGCIVVLSGLVFGRAALFARTFEGKSASESPSRTTLLVMLAALVYVALIPILGFYAASFLCIIAMSLLNTHDGVTPRSFVMTLISGAVFLGFVYLMFSYILQSTIPKGMLL